MRMVGMVSFRDIAMSPVPLPPLGIVAATCNARPSIALRTSSLLTGSYGCEMLHKVPIVSADQHQNGNNSLRNKADKPNQEKMHNQGESGPAGGLLFTEFPQQTTHPCWAIQGTKRAQPPANAPKRRVVSRERHSAQAKRDSHETATRSRTLLAAWHVSCRKGKSRDRVGRDSGPLA
jgi:hypothetical protein